MAHAGSRKQLIDEVVLAIITHQPAAPSASATAAMASTSSIGVASGPPYTAGTHKRISPASTSAATTGALSRRASSASSA